MRDTWHSLLHFFTPHHTNNLRPKILHPSSVAIILAFVCAIQLIFRQTSSSFPQILGYSADISVEEIVALTNAERRARNLPELKVDPQLSQAAAKKAADMFAKNYWSHVSPDGVTPWFFFNSSGYNYRYAGENLARDFTSAAGVVEAWLASPSHKENLLNSRYQDIGVAVMEGKLTGRHTTLVVQLFGSKISTSPPRPASNFSKSPRAVVPKVRADYAENSLAVPNSPQPSALVSQFEANRNLALLLLLIFVLTILIDLAVVYRRSVIRWTSHSLAHLIFFAAVITAIFGIMQGQLK